jgi:hypothetical protein
MPSYFRNFILCVVEKLSLSSSSSPGQPLAALDSQLASAQQLLLLALLGERLDRGQLILQWHQRVHIVPIAFKRLSISAMVIS